jgi:hypothetical protein
MGRRTARHTLSPVIHETSVANLVLRDVIEIVREREWVFILEQRLKHSVTESHRLASRVHYPRIGQHSPDQTGA